MLVLRSRRVAFSAGDQEYHAQSDGNGPVDASLKAIESRLQSGAEMVLYSVNAITSGSTESQGEVTIRLQLGGRVVNGVGADPDIVVASAKAYLWPRPRPTFRRSTSCTAPPIESPPRAEDFAVSRGGL